MKHHDDGDDNDAYDEDDNGVDDNYGDYCD